MPPQWSARGRPSGGVRAGQVVVLQVAGAVLLAALGRGASAVLGGVAVAALLLALAGARVRGRWLFEWLGTALAYVARRRALPAEAGPADLLDLVDPGAVVRSAELAGTPAAVLDDAAGMVALLEILEPGELIGDGSRALPPPAALLSAATPGGPPVRVQLVLAAVAAPAVALGGGAVATSYRQLTDGRLPGRERAVLAVRVLRVDGATPVELRHALAGTLRRIVRRAGPASVRPLGEHAALRVIAELAHHEAGPARESWSALRSGSLLQAGFRLDRWPDPRAEGGRRLVSRLLALPATAVTVALSAGPSTHDTTSPPSGLTVRLAAATPGELATAVQALHRTVDGSGGEVRRLDGEHLAGLAATVPLALPDGGPPGPAAPELVIGGAGLLLGANRHGAAVTVRLFRPEGTRVVLVGGLGAGQMISLRAMALGARVVVQTARPRAWEPFVRGVGTPGGTIPLLPPGRPVGGEPGSPLRPLLLVVDTGPVGPAPEPDPPWQATVLLRDELTVTDVAALGRADLALLQPLGRAEATLAGSALGLGESAEWLTRIREDMVAVVNRRALRWARLTPSPIEAQLIGGPGRH
ncbi:type VII secretion protein EccE [Micromonospora sp. NPDC126480]|uniref:type VII secretion protein EccE n=1 Tax=Micromonospora sp. NPDC126480 TaxID=3155312 RepID=UPI00332D3DF3